jgi:hypothetical protein
MNCTGETDSHFPAEAAFIGHKAALLLVDKNKETDSFTKIVSFNCS